MSPAVTLILEVIASLAALAPQIPQIAALVASVTGIVQTGTVTDAQEADIRAQLDAVKALVDAG